MDPALDVLTRTGVQKDVIEAVARMRSPWTDTPDYAQETTRFGEIRTLRLRRSDIYRAWKDPRVASLKAPRLLQFERPILHFGFATRNVPATRRPRGIRQSGKGVVVGIIDWGFDFAHPAFLREDGSSRIISLWDQRPSQSGRGNQQRQKFRYGRIYSRREIDAALRSRRPYAKLGYHPGDADTGIGTHGSHVADIAAGSMRAGGAGGLAPDADLVFVHLSSGPLGGLADLGDSVRILEAVAYCGQVAGQRPLVINMSIGRHGGPHTGLTLLERALDVFVQEQPNRQIIQSAGNYYGAAAHASGVLAPGRSRHLSWEVARSDQTGNELEIWYSNRDVFSVELSGPNGGKPVTVKLGSAKALQDQQGHEVGRLYHRAFDPNTPDHHIDIFLHRNAAPGQWHISLQGLEISDGRYDAWIERDPGGRRGQSRFTLRDVDRSRSTGSICNGFRTIAVGAADVRGPFVGPASFASSGPTRDGRKKPDLVAPGVRIRAARSASRAQTVPSDRATIMSGASQAAPYVAGVAALCLEAGNGKLDAHGLRRVLIGTATPLKGHASENSERLGAGLVNPMTAVAEAAEMRGHADVVG